MGKNEMSYEYIKNRRLATIDKVSLKLGSLDLFNNLSLRIDNILRPGVEQGQIVGLLGPSGIGKSQLLRIIAGLQQPDSGAVRFHSETETTLAREGSCGMVFQNYPLLPHRTVYGNLSLVANDERVAKYLDFVGLSSKKNSYPSELSGGERQRIAIIQQFLVNEKFLLLDEPLTGLDPKAKRNILDLLTAISLRHEHNTIILTTHDVAAAIEVCDLIWVLTDTPEPGKANLCREYDLAAMQIAWRPKHLTAEPRRLLQLEIESLF